MFVNSSASRLRSIYSRLSSNTVQSVKTNQPAVYFLASRAMSSGGEVGSGAGKGGGAGGSIREAGGSLGKKGAAQEEQWFNKQSKALKDKLKEHLKEEIKKHEDAIKASKDIMKEIEKKE